MASVFSFLPLIARRWLEKHIQGLIADYGAEVVMQAFKNAPIDYLLRLRPDTSPKEFMDGLLNGTFGKRAAGTSETALVPYDGGKKSAAKTYTKDRYRPTTKESLAYGVLGPLAGDAAQLAGTGVNITQSALGSMLAAMSNSNKQSQYSHMTPAAYSAGSGLMAIGKSALGQFAQSVGDTLSNRIHDISAEKWAQANTDANRRFYIDHEPTSAQQELEAQVLKHNDRRSNRLQRPGRG